MIFPPIISNLRGKTAALVDAVAHPRQWHYYWKRFKAWLQQNWGTIAMNVGSICTLIGFVRTDVSHYFRWCLSEREMSKRYNDPMLTLAFITSTTQVLELRTFSMCGSIGAILYNLAQSPMRMPPILWSATFASVNAFKIYQIRVERGAAVHLTAKEEETYNRFFLPHGVTPKQFETIYHKANHVQVAKDECILRKDDPLDHVYLIVDGTTKANIRGRHLTAASFSPETHETRQGGASGAWVGEMAFLEQYWFREQAKRQKAAAAEAESKMENDESEKAPESETVMAVSKEKEDTNTSEEPNTKVEEPTMTVAAKQRVAPGNGPALVAKTPRALYSIVAKDDCRLLQWSHEEMEELLAKSTDLRASMTRAMTQAIVGKTINFIVSKGSGMYEMKKIQFKDLREQQPLTLIVCLDPSVLQVSRRGLHVSVDENPFQVHDN